MADVARNPQNIGLQAKILSERTFTIFVVMALVRSTRPLIQMLLTVTYQLLS